MGSFPPFVAFSPPYVELAGSLGDLRLFEDCGFLMWPVSSRWQVVWGFHPTRALSLERFRSESFMISPPCLRSDLLKHLIVVCPCARIACALMPWFKRFEHPTIRSVEDCFFGLPAWVMAGPGVWVAQAGGPVVGVYNSSLPLPHLTRYGAANG
uniref:Uncharacterized protein n=1 Tax=Fagus sylvatica TaxID=28930 RepID=A0A2N9IXG6_FAGSY